MHTRPVGEVGIPPVPAVGTFHEVFDCVVNVPPEKALLASHGISPATALLLFDDGVADAGGQYMYPAFEFGVTTIGAA